MPKLAAEEQPIRFHLEEIPMSQTDTPVIAPDAPAVEEIQADQVTNELVEDDELVEEISIDGMCGVY